MTPTVLIVDDDERFTSALERVLRRRDWHVHVAHDIASAVDQARRHEITHATVDLRLGEESGLSLIPELLKLRPGLRILVLTGFASIATAVEAVKLGAINYLAKPVEASEVVAALLREEETRVEEPPVELETRPMSVARMKWEHIQRVLAENDGNVSATARALGMHRRTLQRMLAKKPSPR